METPSLDSWRKCSTCKKPIGFNKKYYVCSVSSCNGQRTGYVFCSVVCCEAHVPGARHRDSSAIEMTSPSSSGASTSAASAGARRILPVAAPQPSPRTGSHSSTEVLIVASKLKDYIRARSEMNTAAEVMDVLSDIVRRLADQAIAKAQQDGRKTVMRRDF